MEAATLADLLQGYIASATPLRVTYLHTHDGSITTHQVIPYSVEPGKRSKSGKPMFWGFCLDHQRIEQREPENVLSIEPVDQPTDQLPPSF